MNDDKKKQQQEVVTPEKEVYGPSILLELQELLDDKEEYRP